jgi:hypothetical protein
MTRKPEGQGLIAGQAELRFVRQKRVTLVLAKETTPTQKERIVECPLFSSRTLVSISVHMFTNPSAGAVRGVRSAEESGVEMRYGIAEYFSVITDFQLGRYRIKDCCRCPRER